MLYKYQNFLKNHELSVNTIFEICTCDMVKRQNNKNLLSEKHKLISVIIPCRLQVIVDAHPKELIGVKIHQTVFLTGLDEYIGIVCTVQKRL